MAIGQKQRLDHLRFFLYDRPVHPEFFDIYQSRRIVKPGYEAEIWITGCSHVVGFFRPGSSLLEVTADGESEMPPRGQLLKVPFRGEKDHERKTEGINYMVSFQVETMSQAVYSKTHRDLARHHKTRGLFVPFPMWMANSLTPFTFIDYDAKPNELHVYAFHAFPAELTVVKTQSIFELS